ncbi:hypothetical protein ScPMuIL_005507 [Solemya velum]
MFSPQSKRFLQDSCEPSVKRIRVEQDFSQTNGHTRGRSFLYMNKDSEVYESSHWIDRSTMFRPLEENLYLNVHKFDKLSTTRGEHFVSDNSGGYSRTVQGSVLHIWKFDLKEQYFQRVQSFLFTNTDEFQEVERMLHSV